MFNIYVYNGNFLRPSFEFQLEELSKKLLPKVYAICTSESVDFDRVSCHCHARSILVRKTLSHTTIIDRLYNAIEKFEYFSTAGGMVVNHEITRISAQKSYKDNAYLAFSFFMSLYPQIFSSARSTFSNQFIDREEINRERKISFKSKHDVLYDGNVRTTISYLTHKLDLVTYHPREDHELNGAYISVVQDDVYQLENKEMSCDNVNVNYYKLSQFYEQRSKLDSKMKANAFNNLIPPPLSSVDRKMNRVGLYVTEINADFFCNDATPCSIQDPVWVNYDVDSHQVQLDKPLLSTDNINWGDIYFRWQRNCILTSLINVMDGYGGISNSSFSLVKLLLNGVCRKFAELTNNESEEFFENFLLFVMTMCTRQWLEEINEELKSLGKEEFKLIYSPSIPNFLSVLNIFRRSLGNSDDVNLSYNVN